MALTATITSKTIDTSNIKRLVVAGDAYDSIRFTVAKTYDGTDLSAADWYLRYVLNNDLTDLILLSATVSGDNLLLDWTPSGYATSESGVMEIQLYCSISSTVAYQTKPAKIYIEQTLDVTVSGEFTPSVLTQYLTLFESSLSDAEAAQAAAEAAATAAAASETAAATSETNAASSATAAQTAQTAAETAQTAAEAAQAQAETIYDNFDDRYLGSKATDPTLDNDGDALTEGLLYWNSTTKKLKIYNGTAWVLSTANAADINIADAGGRYTGTDAEAALQEIAGSGRTTETVKGNADDIATLETAEAAMKGTGWTTENLVDHETRIGINETDIAANVSNISENTQLIASKDQSNLNAHNSITKRLAIAEAETYNGTDLENYEPTNEAGIATDGTDISASVVDGSAEVQTEGKSYGHELDGEDGFATVGNWSNESGTAVALAVVNNELIVEGDGSSDNVYIKNNKGQNVNLPANYYTHLLIKTDSANVDNFYIYYDGSTAGTIKLIATQASPSADTWYKISIRTTLPANATGKFTILVRTNYATAGDSNGAKTYIKPVIIENLLSLDLDTTLTTTALCDAYFNYVDGLRSSLSHSVESSDKNVFDKTKVTRGYKLDTDGTLIVSATDYTSDYMIIRPSVDWVGQDEEYAFFDSNFNFISYGTGATAQAAPSNAFYERISSALTTLDTMQIEQASTATTYQPHKSNYAHVPVTLNQVPTAQDTFDIKTGVHGVNTLEYTLTADDITGLATTPVNLDYVEINKPLDSLVYGNTTAIGGSVTQEGASGDTTYADDVSRINYIFQASNLVYGFGVTNGTYADLTAAKTALTGTKIIYELADASKYTVQYPPQNLIGYTGGQISRIPKLRSNGISVAGTVSLGTIPISRMGDVYEYIGAESSLVDPDDITLASDGLSFDVAGGGSDEVYDYVGFYDTSYSTYPTQQIQYSVSNVASKIAKDQKTITVVNAATYDTVNTDNVLLVTYTATGAVTSLTLTSAMALQTGRVITIKDAGGNASVNNITIDTEGSETIDGAATLVMSTNYQTIRLIADGTNWWRID